MRDDLGPVKVFTYVVYENGKHSIRHENYFLTGAAAYTWAKEKEAEVVKLPGAVFAGSLGVDPDTPRYAVNSMIRDALEGWADADG